MKEVQFELFAENTAKSGIARPVIDMIKGVARRGHPLVVAWSSGRDSTACLNLTLVALKELSSAGELVPQVVVLHADPLVENPAVHQHAMSEIASIKRYAAQHGMPIRVEISTPSLLSQWAVKVISGRNLPPLPGRPRDCTIDLKITPMKRLQSRVFKEIAREGMLEPVKVIGTRFAESAGRKKRMEGRGETHEGIWQDKEGLKLSPIAHWSDNEQ